MTMYGVAETPRRRDELSAVTEEHCVTALMSEPGIKENERGGGGRERDRENISQATVEKGTFGAGSFTLMLRMSGISPYESVGVYACTCVKADINLLNLK